MLSKKAPFTLLLHIALAIIIAGACVTHWSALHGSITIMQGEPQSQWTETDGQVRNLPFSLTLDSCVIDYYPATTSARDYSSLLTVNKSGHSVEQVEVRMNHSLEIDGYRFCQSGMTQESTILTVCHDPWGIPITYAGYFTLFFSMIAFFFQRRANGFRALLASPLLKRGAAMISLAIGSAPAFAATNPPVINEEVADAFSHLYIYNDNRVEPMQTWAREFCAKVCGKDHFENYSAEQVMLGWILDYDSWKRQPMIKIKGAMVREALGVKDDYASLTDFFGPQGYKLDPLLSDLTNANVQRANESVQLIISVCTGQAMLIYPYFSSLGRMEWLSWVDSRPSKMELDQWIMVSQSMGSVAQAIAQGDNAKAAMALHQIREYQVKTCTQAGYPLSEAKFKAELFYNCIAHPLPMFIILLCLGLGALVLRAHAKLCGIIALVIGLAWTTAMLVLRAVIAGHWPLSNGPETMQFLAWVSLLLAWLCAKKFPVLRGAGILVAAFALLVSSIGSDSNVINNLLPVLASPLLSVHVMVVMLSYALFGMIAIISLMGLCSRGDASARFAVVAKILLYPGVFLLAAGIFLGAIWANSTWGRYWGWDPKETWALITMCIYAVPLHWIALKPFRKPRVVHIYLLLAFASVLMTYFGVNFFLGGLHSYA